MYKPLGPVTLKSGEIVEAGVVIGPDLEWRERIEKLLQHKGDPWDWQNTELLTKDVGIEAYFHVLHRDGMPFSHIMTCEYNGVGILGHVWTNPDDRRQGATSQLMRLQMEQFRLRGGQALYLGTGYDSPAYHIYRQHGFQSIEPQSGIMTYFTTPREEFESTYFVPGNTAIEPVDWPHWATGSALFSADLPGVVRGVPAKLIGRTLTEGALVPVIKDIGEQHKQGRAPHAWALRKPENGAVVGLAIWNYDPTWWYTCQVDVYCHPNFWDQAGALLAQLQLPHNHRIIAYCDVPSEAKRRVLEAAGFRPVVTLPQWVAVDTARTAYVDVVMFEKS